LKGHVKAKFTTQITAKTISSADSIDEVVASINHGLGTAHQRGIARQSGVGRR
jgi:hypothetical protein